MLGIDKAYSGHMVTWAMVARTWKKGVQGRRTGSVYRQTYGCLLCRLRAAANVDPQPRFHLTYDITRGAEEEANERGQRDQSKKRIG